MKVLILGISGATGRQLTEQLLAQGHEVIGIDRRPWPDAPVEVHQLDIRKRPAEDIFRTRRPQAVVHLATVTWLALRGEERERINLGGTRAVFHHCETYGVEHAIFVGRHTFYGVGPDLPLFHTEDEPPLGVAAFPELIDLVAADLYAGAALWRIPSLTTTVLRVCYTLGPTGRGTLAALLRGSRVPMALGYDPLFQFIHERDAVSAIGLALEHKPRGIFNVVGPPPLPLSIVIRETGRKAVPLPPFVLEHAIGRFGLPSLPKGAINHLKYPVVVDGSAFAKATGFQYEVSEAGAIRDFHDAFPPP